MKAVIGVIFLLLNIYGAWANTARPLGVVWKPPISESQARDEITRLAGMGFQYLLIDGIPAETLLPTLEAHGMRVILQAPLRYVTAFDASRNQDFIKETIDEGWRVAGKYPLIEGYSVLWEAAVHRPGLLRALSVFRPASTPENMLYYVASQAPATGYAMPHTRLILVYDVKQGIAEAANYPGAPLVLDILEPEKEHIENWFKLLSAVGSARVYLPGSFLLSNTPESSELLTLLAEMDDPVNPVIPKAKTLPVHDENGYAVLLFALLVVIAGLHYGIDPTYRKSVNRFFYSNRFFVDDLVNRRLKLSISNYIVLFQLCALFGTAALAFAEYTLTDSGFAMISSFIPIAGPEMVLLLFFIAGFITGFIPLLILILWGGYMNKAHCHLSHYVTVFLWPQHLLFLFVMLLIVSLQLSSNATILALLWYAALLTPPAGYLYASGKLAKHSYKNGLMYLLLTLLPPFTLLAVLWAGVHLSSPIPDLIDLARQLP